MKGSWHVKRKMPLAPLGTKSQADSSQLSFQASNLLKVLSVRYHWGLDLDAFGMPLVSVLLCM